MKSFHARNARPAPQVRATQPKPSSASLHGGLRLDVLLVEKGLAPSRTAAQRLIESGRVSGPAGVYTRPSLIVAADETVTLQEDEGDRYVSRGGLKLAGALALSGVSAANKVCLDVGQSTGGFTDCLLQAGASQIVGVDVGHDQLHPQLRQDPRVIALEGINARHLLPADLGKALPAEGFDLIVGDISFISLTLILPQLPALLHQQGHLLMLVKPQFELGPQALGKGGVVKDPGRYPEVEAKLRQCAANCGLTVKGWFDSPIIGGGVGNLAGNREFFIWTQHA